MDRAVSDIEAIDDSLRFKFHSRGPVISQEGHSSYSYNYPMSSIDIPIDALPRAIKVDDFAIAELGDIDWMTEFSAARPIDVDIDFSEVDGGQWIPRPLEDERVAECVAWVKNQLERLAGARAYADIRVSVVGDWPATEVVAEFHRSEWGDRLVRHRVRVFDDAGRPALQRYMTVYLEETLATSRPSDHPEVDGAIEVQA